MMKFNFTKDQVITEHRKMWLWIYTETIRQKRPVSKNEYLEKNNIFGLCSDCFLCEYSVNETIKHSCGAVFHFCDFCPLDWGSKAKNTLKCVRKVNFKPKTNFGAKIFGKLFAGYFYRWREAFQEGDYKAAAKYAYKIANLKEKNL